MQHDYFSSFHQSDHCFLASSFLLPLSLLKLPKFCSHVHRKGFLGIAERRALSPAVPNVVKQIAKMKEGLREFPVQANEPNWQINNSALKHSNFWFTLMSPYYVGLPTCNFRMAVAMVIPSRLYLAHAQSFIEVFSPPLMVI